MPTVISFLRQNPLVPGLLLAVTVFAVYANALHGAFVLDDLTLIVRNRFLRAWGHLPELLTSFLTAGAGASGAFFRPLQGLSYFIVYQLFGLVPAAFHLLNIALHAVNAALLYRLGGALGFRREGAFLAALLWAVHPLFTPAVAYMSGTADPLAMLFMLLALLALLPDFSPPRVLRAALLFLPALLSKETAVVFPALAAACIYLVSPERLKLKTYTGTWPLWLMAAVYILLRLSFAPPVAGAPAGPEYMESVAARFFTALATLPAYLKLMLFPTGLHMERSFPVFTTLLAVPVLLGLVLVALAVWQLVRCRGEKGLPLGWGLIWFVVALSPYTGIIKPVNALIAEHWLYLPAAGLFLGLGETLARLGAARARRVFAVAAMGCALAFGVKTHMQNNVWRDTPSLYGNILKYESPAPIARGSLGTYYMREGQFDKAVEQFDILFATAKDLSVPLGTGFRINAALARLRVSLPATASREEQAAVVAAAIDTAPNLDAVHKELDAALAYNPQAPVAHMLKAMIYEKQGHKAKALKHARRAAERH